MEKPVIKEIKCYARCVLKGHHAVLAGVTLLLTALNLVLSYLALMASPSGTGILSMLIYFGCSIVVNIIYYILLAGLYRIYLDICNNHPFRWTDLFSMFTEHPEPVAIYSILQFFVTWIFVQIAFWWLEVVLNLLFYGEVSISNVLFTTAVLVIAAVLFIAIEISFSMTLFVHANDSDLSFKEMMKESWNLMSGMWLRYLRMQLSFIGMYLLGLLSFGIGLLFVNPYVYTTSGYFYKKISG
ncbi:MAG: DUF975 family protein [Lachnospiraceae bacterium]|nr:DUF975 family protein [Lachnospiraceae bacterium]